jgi:predicted transcriptional regulator
MVADARTIPTIDLMKIRTDMGLSREKMARIVDVSSKTIERWEKGETHPTSRRINRLYAELYEMVELGLIVYTAEGFKWLMTQRVPVFDDRSPLQMLESGDVESVTSLLAAEYEGQGF